MTKDRGKKISLEVQNPSRRKPKQHVIENFELSANFEMSASTLY